MEKLRLGEYTEVVWASYLVAAVVLGLCIVVSLRALKRAKRQLKELGE